MKPGDKFAVNLNEHVVAEAVVIDIEDGKVTLDIPATRIVMGVKSSLTDLPDTVPDKEYAILDDKRPAVTPQAQNSPGAQVVNPNPVQETVPADSTTALPADAIGEGLANVQLKEME
jgi:hypothetical protein